MIKTICCICQAIVHDGPLSPEGWLNHGICPPCFIVQRAELAADLEAELARLEVSDAA